ncbi:O-antigen ligase family protein [Pseudomonadota bacterium]
MIKTSEVKDNLLFYFLCFLTFSIALTSGRSSFNNATIVAMHELLFILAYFLFSKSPVNPDWILKTHQKVFLLFLLWLVSITTSLLFSPYELMKEGLAIRRYYQTIIHILFFSVVFRFLLNQEREKNSELLLLMIPSSCVVLAFLFFLLWLTADNSSELNWFQYPPFGAHIRHIGYIATAAACTAFAFLLHPAKSFGHKFSYLFLTVASLTFLFWTGGRSAAISFFSVFTLLVGYLIYVRSLRAGDLFVFCTTVLIAVFLSKHFDIFDWNGFSGQISRTIDSENVNGLLTGRLSYWESVVDSLEGHWILGLGPQGYYFMPNRIFGVQPHNMFIQFIVEWGLVGASVFLVLLTSAGINIMKFIANRHRKVSISILSSLAILVSLTIHGFVDGTYFHGQPSYYLALAFAICLSSISRDNMERSGLDESS